LDLSSFTEDVRALRVRVDAHRLRGGAPSGSRIDNEVLKELSVALEGLRIAEEELRAQNEELIASRRQLEISHKRYRDLFEFAPGGYLITDEHGVIEEANYMAASLLDRSPSHLAGKPVTICFEQNDRRVIRYHLHELSAGATSRAFTVRASRDDGGMPGTLEIRIERQPAIPGEPARLRWLIVSGARPLAGSQVESKAMEKAGAEVQSLRAEVQGLRRQLRDAASSARPQKPDGIGVMAVDDNELVRDALERKFSGLDGFRWCGSLGCADSLMDEVRKRRPHILLLDLDIPGSDPLTAIPRLGKVDPVLRVIVLSGLLTPALIERALAAGAAGYLSKADAHVELADAVERAFRGETVLGTEVRHVLGR
jgi:PAS domain-containing protein